MPITTAPHHGIGSIIADCLLSYGTAAIGFAGALWAQAAPLADMSTTIVLALIGLVTLLIKGKFDSHVAALEAENRILRELARPSAAPPKPTPINAPEPLPERT